ncbi:putative death-receptor fusion protein-domain-containing protein [Apodospora peruviana]|uniref:Death-receptor fusion protein-domain-containing protein n=1 Tax=Apodospora peruviana TaxID=516989 RepID=A0AAE0IBJ2_9PEZI|nr:putative death-receptor fusion protein-domain-containing protein [Apodospora peruviana]
MDTTTPENTENRANAVQLSDLGPEVFVNANTMTKWILTQAQESRLGIAKALFQKLLHDASHSRQSHGNGHDCVKLCSFVQQCAKSTDPGLKQWAFTEPLSRRLFHFYLEWYEHDPHRALRLILHVLVASSTANPDPETGKLIKAHVLETLVSIVARTSTTQLTKSGLQCLDHFLTKQAIHLDDICLKYREIKFLESHLPEDAAGRPELEVWRSFVFDLFSWMELSYVSPLAGKCIVHIFRGLEKRSAENATPGSTGFIAELGHTWLQDALEQSPGHMDDIKNYVLVPIFKTDKPAALRLLEAFNRQGALDEHVTDQALLIQLAALEIGKKSGLVDEPTSGNLDSGEHLPGGQVALKERLLSNFLPHPSLCVRSSAFSLLVSSQATTKPFSQVAFDLLKKHLPAFHADYDAKLRNEMLGLTKYLIRRVKNVMTVSKRSLAASASRDAQPASADGTRLAAKKRYGPETLLKDDIEAKEILDRHEAFLNWYISFLKSELLPTASYQRHITALRAALLALKIGKHAGATGDFLDTDIVEMISSDSSWIRLLLDLLMDPFEDVRESASLLLAQFTQEIVNAPIKSSHYSATLLEILQDFCSRAQALADRTGRADHGDGAARSQGLLCEWLHEQESQIGLVSNIISALEGKILKAENDLGHAAIENPVHPDFAALSYAWPVLIIQATYSGSQSDVIRGIHRRIFDCCKRIWLAVKHVLCDDSPEGHLPEEMEEIDGLDTKDLLSYSFRAVHESSNLLRLMVGTLRQTPTAGVPFPPLDFFKSSGDLAFEQLSSLRHRGAFSTVSLTFSTCCQLSQNLRNVFPDTTSSDDLLREWYQGTVDCIMTQASTTRRSAGIPALIAAVLAANAESPSFGEVFSTLEEIAKKEVTMSETDGSNLPQVHALNSLREIFRSSLLSKKAESYLAATLLLAANSLKSEVWAIRNCGLLLLRSLIDCLLGTGESKATIESGWDGVSIRISYNKYPTLPGVILGLLQSAGNISEAGAAATLNSAAASAAEAVFPALDIIRRAGPPEEHRAELWGRIEEYLGSRIWHVREIAARTLCSFLQGENWIDEMRALLVGDCGLPRADLNANRLHGILLTIRFAIERKPSLTEDLENLKELLREHIPRGSRFAGCPVLQAAYLEIFNLLSRRFYHEPEPEEDIRIDLTKQDGPSTALLRMETAIMAVYDSAYEATDVTKVRSALLTVLGNNDTNTACRMLETAPKVWEAVQRKAMEDLQKEDGITPELCALYIEVCDRAATAAPEVRAQALLNFGSLIDGILLNHKAAAARSSPLPSTEQLDRLWSSLQRKGELFNPTLACAIIKTSGSLMAATVCAGTSIPNLEQRLRSWGLMIADSLAVDNSFDTRYAAAMALRSFFLGVARHATTTAAWNKPRYLPVLSALYESLVDDDDEIREVAASAAGGVIGRHMVAPAAADHLVSWLCRNFACHKEFDFRLVASRMTGAGVGFTPAEKLLQTAMDFDDSLFAAEEQNLFIDEVRETWRWRENAFFSSSSSSSAVTAAPYLKRWTEDGLEYLVELLLADENEGGRDGPLGWTSDQHVFAVCARVVLCAVAILKTEDITTARGAKRTRELLERFVAAGEKARLHGSLLEMTRLES